MRLIIPFLLVITTVIAVSETGTLTGTTFRRLDSSHSMHLHSSSAQRQNDIQYQAPWHLDRIDQRQLPLDGIFHAQNRGKGVNLYVVSAGINSLHQDFYTFNGQETRVIPAFSIDPYSSPADIDIRGEGTVAAAAAAGLLHGVAKDARIHSVKVFRDDEPNFTAPKKDVLQGLAWIRDHHQKPAVVLWLTFGAEEVSYDVDKEAVLRNLTEARVPVVVSAGFTTFVETTPNSPDACEIAVANSENTMTVSSSSKMDYTVQGEITGVRFAARTGRCVDIYAPGSDLVAPARSPSETELVVVTSPVVAPAIVAGVIATYLETFGNASVRQVFDAVIQASTPGIVVDEGEAAGNLLHSRILPIGSGSLGATLYALNMEFSSGSLRNTGDHAVFGIHFPNLIPANMNEDHLRVQLHDGKPVDTRQLHANNSGRGQVVIAFLPKNYTGKVLVESSHAKLPLSFYQVGQAALQTNGHVFSLPVQKQV